MNLQQLHKFALIWGVVCITAASAQTGAKSKSWNFETDKVGEIAKGFSKEVGEWKVVVDETGPSKGNVLAQLAKSEKPVYNVALVADTSYKNVDLSTKLKAVAGTIMDIRPEPLSPPTLECGSSGETPSESESPGAILE